MGPEGTTPATMMSNQDNHHMIIVNGIWMLFLRSVGRQKEEEDEELKGPDWGTRIRGESMVLKGWSAPLIRLGRLGER